MKTDEMNFHKFHLLREFLGSPETIPVRITGICRLCTLLPSATDTLLTVMEYEAMEAVCLLGLQGYFFSHFSLPLPSALIFFPLSAPPLIYQFTS